MPTAVNVTVSGRVRSTGNRKAPRKMVRGRTRTQVRKTLAKLQSLGSQDAREMRRAASLGYTPVLLFGVANSTINNSYVRLLNRLGELMTKKEGDE